jgi:hypothetical protein
MHVKSDRSLSVLQGAIRPRPPLPQSLLRILLLRNQWYKLRNGSNAFTTLRLLQDSEIQTDNEF